MSNVSSFRVYCLSFQDARKSAMQQRFQEVGLDTDTDQDTESQTKSQTYFYSGVPLSDPRLKPALALGENGVDTARVWSMAYGHLDMLQMFLEDFLGPTYGVFCEDDLVLSREFVSKLNAVLEVMQTNGIDLCMIGYLMDLPTVEGLQGYLDPRIEPHNAHGEPHGMKFYLYPDSLWGAQMYVVSRRGAKKILDQFGGDYAVKTLSDPTLIPFSADWTITKCSGLNRVLVEPMLAVEDGSKPLEHYGGHLGQYWYHRHTYLNHTQNGEYV